MIYEYALQPELVAGLMNRVDFRFLMNLFEENEPVYFAVYPKLNRWTHLVKNNFTKTGKIEDTYLTEFIKFIKTRAIKRIESDYDMKLGWLENAEFEHNRCPFDLILAESNPNAKSFVIAHLTQLSNNPNPRLKIPHDRIVNRIASDMANAVAPMLRLCRKLILVDPHFDPCYDRWRNTLVAFIKAMQRNRCCQELTTVKYLCKVNARSASQFATDCDYFLHGSIPSGITLEVTRLAERLTGLELHNRCILTDLGGVSFEHGLDESPRTGAQDKVTRMSHDSYKKIWDQYVNNIAFNTHENPVVISG